VSWQKIVSAPKQTLDWHANCVELPTLAQRVFHHPAEALNAIRLTATDLGLLGSPDYSLTHSVTQSPARHSPPGFISQLAWRAFFFLQPSINVTPCSLRRDNA